MTVQKSAFFPPPLSQRCFLNAKKKLRKNSECCRLKASVTGHGCMNSHCHCAVWAVSSQGSTWCRNTHGKLDRNAPNAPAAMKGMETGCCSLKTTREGSFFLAWSALWGTGRKPACNTNFSSWKIIGKEFPMYFFFYNSWISVKSLNTQLSVGS